MTIWRDDNPHPTDRFRHVPGSGSARLEGQRHLEREIRCTLEILDRLSQVIEESQEDERLEDLEL
jgi:hypothetical protein